MKSKILVALFMVSGFLALISCGEELDQRYNGPTLVEFKNAYLELQARLGVATFSSIVPGVVTAENLALNSLGVRETMGRDSILVQMVGPQRSTPTTVNFVVADSSTAIEGFNYDLVSQGTVTIPANSSSGYLVLQVYDSLGVSDTSRVSLYLALTGGDGVQPSLNYRTFSYNIIKN